MLVELHRLYDRLSRENRARVLAGLGGALDALAGLPWLDGAEGRGRAVQALLYLLDTARAGIQAAQLPDSGVTAGTYAYPVEIRVTRKGTIEAITAGSASSSLDVAETITFMDGSLGGTWWFRRTPSGAGGGPATIYVGDGLTKTDGSAYSYRAVVVCQTPVPSGETWEVHIFKYDGGWQYVTHVSVSAGSYRAITSSFTLATGQLLAVASVADGAGPDNAQLTLRRG